MRNADRHREQIRDWARKDRAKKKAEGLVQVSGFVHSTQAAEVKRLLRMLLENPDLAATVLRNERTGQFVKID